MTERVLFGPGGATEAKQDAELTALALLSREATQQAIGQVLSAFSSGNHADLLAILAQLGQTLAISAASLPLPTGAATEAKQLPNNHQVAVSNFPTTQSVSGSVALDAPTLAALENINATVAFPAIQPVSDDYTADIVTPDQPGAGGVLTFALGGPAKLVAVDVDPNVASDTVNYICRVTLDGSIPTSSRGWRCRSGQTTYLPVPTSGTVKVFAPTGVFVSVQAGAR